MSVRSVATRARVSLLLMLALCAAPATTFAQDAPAPRGERTAFLSLYASFATLQALDVHSTLRALDGGAVEANPMMRGAASHPAALIALKAGAATSTIFLSERLRKRSRVGALVLMAAANSAYATIVAHNYQAR
jgi:hypothetical protein